MAMRSQFAAEKEILFPPYTMLKVMARDKPPTAPVVDVIATVGGALAAHPLTRLSSDLVSPLASSPLASPLGGLLTPLASLVPGASEDKDATQPLGPDAEAIKPPAPNGYSAEKGRNSADIAVPILFDLAKERTQAKERWQRVRASLGSLIIEMSSVRAQFRVTQETVDGKKFQRVLVAPTYA